MRIKEGIFPKTFADTADFSRKFSIIMRYSGDEYIYIYDPRVNFLNIPGEDNFKILLHVYGSSYYTHVTSIYGYEAPGDWPVFHNINNLINLLNDLEQRGVKMSIKYRSVKKVS